MGILLITTQTTRRRGWQALLEGEDLPVRIAAPGSVELRQALQDALPDLIVVDVADEELTGERWERWLRQLIACLRTRGPGDVIEKVVEKVADSTQGWARATPPADPLRLGDLSLRASARSASVAGRRVALRRREFELLLFFASHPDRVFRREELLEQIWGREFRGSPRTVDTHVRRLRGHLGSFGRRYLQTVRGVGYRLADPR